MSNEVRQNKFLSLHFICYTSFEIIARIEYSLKLFLSIFNLLNVHFFNTPMVRIFGFENQSTLANVAAILIFLFMSKWILIGLRFIDGFWQNNFAPKSRYGFQTRVAGSS